MRVNQSQRLLGGLWPVPAPRRTSAWIAIGSTISHARTLLRTGVLEPSPDEPRRSAPQDEGVDRDGRTTFRQPDQSNCQRGLPPPDPESADGGACRQRRRHGGGGTPRQRRRHLPSGWGPLCEGCALLLGFLPQLSLYAGRHDPPPHDDDLDHDEHDNGIAYHHEHDHGAADEHHLDHRSADHDLDHYPATHHDLNHDEYDDGATHHDDHHHHNSPTDDDHDASADDHHYVHDDKHDDEHNGAADHDDHDHRGAGLRPRTGLWRGRHLHEWDVRLFRNV